MSELHSCFKSVRACKINEDKCTFESKFGSAAIDFSEFKNTELCTLIFRKESGDGQLIIKSDIEERTNVFSKRAQGINVRLENDTKIITISRPNDSFGEISLLSVSLHSNNNDFINESVLLKNWKAIINKNRCNDYNGLRVVDGRLYANEGAYIKPADIVSVIITEPSGRTAIIDNVLKFTTACEVINIEIDGNARPSYELYKHMGEITNIESENQSQRETQVLQFARQKFLVKEQDGSTGPVVIYDSTADSGLSFLPMTGGARVDKPRIYLTANGQITIPLSILKPYTDYVFTANWQKINGNGKVAIKLSTIDGSLRNESTFISVGVPQNINYTFNTGRSPDAGDTYALIFYRPEGSFGDVIIHKCIITGSIIETKMLQYNANKTFIAPSHVNFSFGSDNSGDEVTLSAKKYSRETSFFSEYKNEELSGRIFTTTLSGKKWLNKVSTLFPKIESVSSQEIADIVMCAADAIVPAKKVYLEEFENISDGDLNLLSNTEYLYSPSFSNIKYLNEKLPNIITIHTNKFWPYVDSQELNYLKNKDYILLFNRSSELTSKVIQSWTPNLPKIVLVGARGSLPDCVIPINEYISYNKLMYIIMNTKCIIDLSICNNYISNLLHFSSTAELPIISNNKFIENKLNCIYLEDINNINENVILNILAQERKIKELSKNYNDNIKNNLQSFLGEGV